MILSSHSTDYEDFDLQILLWHNIQKRREETISHNSMLTLFNAECTPCFSLMWPSSGTCMLQKYWENHIHNDNNQVKKFLTMCSHVEVYHNLFIHPEDGGRRILSNNPYQTIWHYNCEGCSLALTKALQQQGWTQNYIKFASLLRGTTRQTK